MTKQQFHALRISAMDCADFEQFVAECGGSMPEEYFASGVDITAAMRQIWDLAYDFNYRRLHIIHGQSFASFASAYNIPIRTLEEWSAGRRTPPEYVLEFMAADVLANRIPTVTEE